LAACARYKGYNPKQTNKKELEEEYGE